MQGKTKSGFSYTCDERIFSDWRFAMAVSRTQNGTDMERLAGAGEMVQLILGKDGYNALLEHISKKNDGMVPAEAVMAEVTEIINSFKDAKN